MLKYTLRGLTIVSLTDLLLLNLTIVRFLNLTATLTIVRLNCQFWQFYVLYIVLGPGTHPILTVDRSIDRYIYTYAHLDADWLRYNTIRSYILLL